MASYSIERLESELAASRHAPLYLLLGAESFLRDEALGALKSFVFERSPRDFNYDTHDAGEGQLEHALASARTLPMMGPLRLVVIRRIDELYRKAKGGAKAKSKVTSARKRRERIDPVSLFEDYVADPEPRSIVVLTAEKVDRRRRVWKQLDQAGVVVELRPLFARDVPGWISRRATRMGLRLEGNTSGLLADLLGSDLGAIVRSLEKLQLYVGERGAAGPEDVGACVARTRIHTVFNLMDAVGRRQTASALTLLYRMLEGSDSRTPLRLLSMLIRQIRRVWTVQSLSGDGVQPRELADRLGVYPSIADDLCRQSRLFSRADLMRAFDLLFDTDRALKTSGGEPARVLELLVLGLCAGGAR